MNSDISQILKDEKDAATLVFMVQDAQKIGAKIVKTVVDQVIQLDKDTMNISGKEATKIRAAYKLNLEDELQTASKEIEAIPDLRWAAFVKDKKQYKAYQIKVGKSFTKGVFSIGKGLVGLATSSFTGGDILSAGDNQNRTNCGKTCTRKRECLSKSRRCDEDCGSGY